MRPTGALTVAPPVLDLDDTTSRLAELVAHLTGCPARIAVEAVGRCLPPDGGNLDDDERLAVVARAMVFVRRLLDLRDQRPA